MNIFAAIGALALMWPSIVAAAADYPAPKEGDWLARDFKFHTGEMTPELKLHYTTVGDPAGTPVVVLHGTGGSAASVRFTALASTSATVEVLDLTGKVVAQLARGTVAAGNHAYTIPTASGG